MKWFIVGGGLYRDKCSISSGVGVGVVVVVVVVIVIVVATLRYVKFGFRLALPILSWRG